MPPSKLRFLSSRLPILDTRTARLEPKRADPFYLSREWRSLLANVITERGRRCEVCGKTTEADGSPVKLVGDHTHEIRDGGAPLDPANIRLMDYGCHARKTQRARAERFARKT